MGKFDKQKAKLKQITADVVSEAEHFREVAEEYNRVANIYQAPAVILHNIEDDFNRATKLNGVDISFLFFATALQCVRQYFLTNFKDKEDRPSDKEAAEDTWGHGEEHSSRGVLLYNPSLKEIIENPVPFDAIFGSKDLGIGLGGNNHRFKTLGHDPILGWIFGTANIATSTITLSDFESFHVATGHTKRGDARDKITEPANTFEVFNHIINKMITKEGRWDDGVKNNGGYSGKNNKLAGPAILATSVFKEAIHLKTDVGSKDSLPFPVISTISPELAQEFAEYGLDMCNIANIGYQATYAALINFLVATIHRMLYKESLGIPQSMYEVKTRKILTYSNVIASASNVIAVAVTEAIAIATDNADLAKQGIKYFDIGGLGVTLYRLISDYKFIKEVKLEFMEKQWYDIVLGEDYSFMKEDFNYGK